MTRLAWARAGWHLTYAATHQPAGPESRPAGLQSKTSQVVAPDQTLVMSNSGRAVRADVEGSSESGPLRPVHAAGGPS